MKIKNTLFGFEPKKATLLPIKTFYKRLFANFLLALAIILVSLSIGIIGYMTFAHLRFVDALLNASMILGGMGPVDVLQTDEAKYFASFYALFSGITFLSIIAVLVAPIIHRAMHRFHLETEEEEESKK